MIKMDLIKAINSLKKGDIIVYPTDTQYALGADIFNNNSIKNLFKIKKRPLNNPIPIALANYNVCTLLRLPHSLFRIWQICSFKVGSPNQIDYTNGAKRIWFLGILWAKGRCGCVLRVKPAEHIHIQAQFHQFPKSQEFFQAS